MDYEKIRAALAAMRAREQAAMAGPWQECGNDRGGCVCGLVWSKPLDCTVAVARPDVTEDEGVTRPDGTQKRTAAFIAHSRTDIQRLLAVAEAALAAKEARKAYNAAARGTACDAWELADNAFDAALVALVKP